jgi:hypothetical protein
MGGLEILKGRQIRREGGGSDGKKMRAENGIGSVTIERDYTYFITPGHILLSRCVPRTAAFHDRLVKRHNNTFYVIISNCNPNPYQSGTALNLPVHMLHFLTASGEFSAGITGNPSVKYCSGSSSILSPLSHTHTTMIVQVR